ncbi:hypothetical protein BGX28_001391 [Mortierella sp. GBA30]|nr:hypothetical protein BGX28_001391 [Mortierella sp. GBA30]
MSPHPPALSPSIAGNNIHHLNRPNQSAQPLLSPEAIPRLYSITPDQPEYINNPDHEQYEPDAEDYLSGEDRGLNHHGTRAQVPTLLLYAVHALCTFDERIYEFASYFFIMEIFKTTLLPMSVYGFSTTVAGILFSTTVGSLVDSTPRLSAVQSFLFAQKFTTVLGALGFWILLTWFDPALPNNTENSGVLSLYQGYCIFAFLVLASGVLKLSALGWSISIERDWIVSLCQSDSELLTKLNVTMKRIDLVCKLVSPLVFAALLTQIQTGYCSLMMAIWCIGSFSLELILVRNIWFKSPVLWEPRSVHFRDPMNWNNNNIKKNSGRGIPSLNGSSEAVAGTGSEDVSDEEEARSYTSTTHSLTWMLKKPDSLLRRGILSFREYSQHVVFLGFSAGSIALLKGICTASELIGTIAMPIMTRYVGLIRGGAWSVWFEVAALTPVLFSIYSDGLPVQVLIFAGMALSRVGVWSFDLVITQIMQEFIRSDSNHAGVINGWHYSMMNIFELAQFILTMIWYNPDSYFIPCTLSFVCVIIGALIYSAYLIRMRGHLFHYQRIMSATTSSCLITSEGNAENDGQSGFSRRYIHRVDDNHDDGDESGAGVVHRRASS